VGGRVSEQLGGLRVETDLMALGILEGNCGSIDFGCL
jgi:hypothetical protein